MGKFIASIPPHGRSIASFGDMAAPMPHVRAMTAACHSSATRPRHYSIFAHGRITSFARWPQHLRDDRSIPQKCGNAAATSREWPRQVSLPWRGSLARRESSIGDWPQQRTISANIQFQHARKRAVLCGDSGFVVVQPQLGPDGINALLR